MWIKKIKLNNFRNYKKEEIKLKKGINIFYGENAQGKTNIIEAIYLCAMGKSFRTNKDKEMIKIDSENSIIEAEYEKEDRDGKIKISLENKKNVFLNGIKIKKLSELISNLNIVIFTPDDINILKGGPQNRRKFLDIMIGQLKPNYIYILNNYLKTLEQRNIYLRQIKEEGKNQELLDIWDEKISEYAVEVYKYRKEFMEKIEKQIKKTHKEITNNKEEISIQYISECDEKEKYKKKLKERRNLDIIKGYTTKGVHRDDFIIKINDKEVNIYGSQGQHRTAILSLKLAELTVVEEEIQEFPILLLDDFVSELDKNRIHNFLEKIGDIQVIITCTEKLDIEKKEIFIYNVKDGKVYNENNR